VTVASSRRVERFRQNEALRGIAETLQGPFGFRCECKDPDCRELVVVEAGDVRAVRANPRRLVMAIGHETGQERVVLDQDGFVIVELGDTRV
jgi:hypothetical protein